MYTIGVDLGGTNIVAGLVDADCNIVETVSCKTNLPRPASEIIDDMASLCAQVIEKAPAPATWRPARWSIPTTCALST